MIKVEVIEEFCLARFNELKNIERVAKEEKGKLFKGDKFECTKDLADYLLGQNKLNRPVVKVIEVEPEIKLTHGDKIKENVIPLDKEKLEEISEKIEKHIQIKPSKKKKSKK